MSRSPSPTPDTRLSVAFVLLNNFTITPFAVLVDLFRLVADEGDLSRQMRCRWDILSETNAPVRASCGTRVSPTARLSDEATYDYIFVIGGILHAAPPASGCMHAFLQRAAARGITLAGVCTGVMELIEAGVMDGHKCCVSWFHYGDLVERYPDVEPVANQIFVVEGKRISCAGGAGALDMGAWIVERHFGPAPARKALGIMLVDTARPGISPQPHPARTQQATDPVVRRALLIMEQNMANVIRIAPLAKSLGLSSRELERRFKVEFGRGPAAHYLALRLTYARWLLINGARTVTEIAQMSGFVDAAHLARRYKTAYGYSPSRERDQTAIPNETPAPGP